MISIVDTLSKFRFQSANVILESTIKHSTLWLGDFTAAIDKRWQRQNNIYAVLTVASGLNIEPAEGVVHMVIDAYDVEEYDISVDFDKGCEFILTNIKKGPVFVHCAAGVSRSASMVICFLMRSFGWSFQKAYQHTKSKRSVISPNPGFVKCLKNEEKKLKLGHGPEMLDKIERRNSMKQVKKQETVAGKKASIDPVENNLRQKLKQKYSNKYNDDEKDDDGEEEEDKQSNSSDDENKEQYHIDNQNADLKKLFNQKKQEYMVSKQEQQKMKKQLLVERKPPIPKQKISQRQQDQQQQQNENYNGVIRGTAKFIIKNSSSNLKPQRQNNRSASGNKKLERFNRIFDDIINDNDNQNNGWKTTQNRLQQNKQMYKKRTFY